MHLSDIHFLALIEHVVFTCSILSVLLPPMEFFDKFPRFQVYYRALVKVITYYGALNLRGKIAAAYNNANSAVNGGTLPKL